jgi:hypothetical protein
MPLLTPIERVMLEMIRDLHHAPPERVEWAMEKGYAEPAGKGRQLRLTQVGIRVLLRDAERRTASRSANRPRSY